jgi:hypothetical protein
MRGAAAGLLFADGRLAASDVVELIEGHLSAAKNEDSHGAQFLVGLLATARSVLWRIPEIIAGMHEFLKDLDEDRFVGILPHLRLAFSDLTPRETQRVAGAVAEQAGVKEFRLGRVGQFQTQDMLWAAEINRRVMNVLKRDGLEVFFD